MAAGDLMLNPFRSLFSSRKRRVLLVQAPRRRTSLAPAVVLAAGAGAGAAFWWWTQWERGAVEDAERRKAATDAVTGVSPVVDVEVAKTLDESLAVQADAGRDVAPADQTPRA